MRMGAFDGSGLRHRMGKDAGTVNRKRDWGKVNLLFLVTLISKQKKKKFLLMKFTVTYSHITWLYTGMNLGQTGLWKQEKKSINNQTIILNGFQNLHTVKFCLLMYSSLITIPSLQKLSHAAFVVKPCVYPNPDNTLIFFSFLYK